MSERPNRQSHRYKGYDYSSAGAYFITICERHGLCRFGKIRQHEMILNEAGQAIHDCWMNLPDFFDNIALDAFQIMPNHVHFIIWLQRQPDYDLSKAPAILSDVVGAFKSLTTNAYIQGVKEFGWPRFEKKLWQRDYWDRIMRDGELERFRSYISANPARWVEDQLHPDAPPNKFNRHMHGNP